MKTILITGSTDGIGKLTAIQLAKQGHRIFMHGRNKAKLLDSIQEVSILTGNREIKGFVSDFSILAEVYQFADFIKSEISSLDVLINNAGIFNSVKERTRDGFDIRFAVNYFAPFVLTSELTPVLQTSQYPRVINLSSAAQQPVSLEALKGNQKLTAQNAYAQSKLALTMWSMHLAKEESNLVSIPVNPGSLLNTKMVKEAFGQYWSSADKGANILTELAISEKILSKSGNYFDNDRGTFSQAHIDAYDQEKINELMEVTKQLLQ